MKSSCGTNGVVGAPSEVNTGVIGAGRETPTTTRAIVPRSTTTIAGRRQPRRSAGHLSSSHGSSSHGSSCSPLPGGGVAPQRIDGRGARADDRLGQADHRATGHGAATAAPPPPRGRADPAGGEQERHPQHGLHDQDDGARGRAVVVERRLAGGRHVERHRRPEGTARGDVGPVDLQSPAVVERHGDVDGPGRDRSGRRSLQRGARIERGRPAEVTDRQRRGTAVLAGGRTGRGELAAHRRPRRVLVERRSRSGWSAAGCRGRAGR